MIRHKTGGGMGVEGMSCLVTGGSGLVGQRLVEMLAERGARRVVSFDIAPKPKGASDDARIQYVRGDLTKLEDVKAACEGGIDCVWHIGALVGPYHEFKAYRAVNYQGTLNVLEAMRALGIKKGVMSSSPSTRFDGSDMDGVKDSEIPIRPRGQFLEAYAETKAMGEVAFREASDGESMLTVAVAPHQVYGPRDNLMLPNLTAAALSGKLRIFGSGKNKVSFTFVDNYCHGLIIAEEALYPGSPALGQFYIVTDDGYELFWEALDRAFCYLGGEKFTSLLKRFHYPTWMMMGAAHVATCVGKIIGKKFKLKPFSVKMLVIDRWFDITRAKEDLGYKPVVSREEGWRITLEWFREHWLPTTPFAA